MKLLHDDLSSKKSGQNFEIESIFRSGMKSFIVVGVIFFICSLSLIVYGQSSTRSKIDRIIQYQDRRFVEDGTLIHFFNDPDPVVRERAVRAFGSIQDTSVIGALLDRLTYDQDDRVRYAAAFALGQTGSQLSGQSREKLEHEIIWDRLDRMPSD